MPADSAFIITVLTPVGEYTKPPMTASDALDEIESAIGKGYRVEIVDSLGRSATITKVLELAAHAR